MVYVHSVSEHLHCHYPICIGNQIYSMHVQTNPNPNHHTCPEQPGFPAWIFQCLSSEDHLHCHCVIHTGNQICSTHFQTVATSWRSCPYP